MCECVCVVCVCVCVSARTRARVCIITKCIIHHLVCMVMVSWPLFRMLHEQGWPEPYIYTYIYTVYLVIFKPKIPYVRRIYMVLARTIHIYGILGRKITKYTVICSVCTRYFGQENHQIYGHMRCIYTVLANPIYIRCIYGIFGREITKYTVICSVYTRFGPTLRVSGVVNHVLHHLTWVQLRHIKL